MPGGVVFVSGISGTGAGEYLQRVVEEARAEGHAHQVEVHDVGQTMREYAERDNPGVNWDLILDADEVQLRLLRSLALQRVAGSVNAQPGALHLIDMHLSFRWRAFLTKGIDVHALESMYSVSAQFPLPAASDGRPGQASGIPELDAISRGVFEAVLRSADTRLIVELPVVPASHNATRVAEDGRRLEWDLSFGETNPAGIELSVPRYSRGALVLAAAFGVGAIVALALAVLVVVLRGRRAL